jgi:DNA-binding PadR family transcriptional regulator
MLEVTDGNLATHLVNLEENGFIKVYKGFIGRKTNTTYSITKAGEKAFNDHIAALEKMIKGVK